MPTFSPAKNLVPRWRTMMLPAEMDSPPNFFTPSLWPGESRPLREEPPAFLCAIVFVLARVNSRDLHFGEVLAGAALSMCVLAALLLEGDDLGPAAMFQDFRFH